MTSSGVSTGMGDHSQVWVTLHHPADVRSFAGLNEFNPQSTIEDGKLPFNRSWSVQNLIPLRAAFIRCYLCGV